MQELKNIEHISNMLSILEINKIYNIIINDINDEEKVKNISNYSSKWRLIQNIEYYKDNQDILNKLNVIIAKYEEYENKKYFKRTPYKTTLDEMDIRINKIIYISEVFKSNLSDYEKAERLLNCYENSNDFKRAYTLFIMNGKKDPRLFRAQEALSNFDYFYSKFVEFEQNGIIESVKYYLVIKDYLLNYKYANFVINEFIQSEDSYREQEFLNDLGINKDVFDFCIDTIKELNPELYNSYLEKAKNNNELRFFKLNVTISSIIEGIKTGYLPNGEPFDEIELIKRIPFKNCKNLRMALTRFMSSCNRYQDYLTITQYMNSHNLLSYTFNLIDLNALYSTKTIINGKIFFKEDYDCILDYIRLNNLPIINRTYLWARTKYLNGEFDKDTINELKSQNTNKAISKTLIPKI